MATKTKAAVGKATFQLALYEDTLYQNAANQERMTEWHELRQFKRNERAAMERQLATFAGSEKARAELEARRIARLSR